MRRVSSLPVVLVLAACVLAPVLLALVAAGLGATATQGLSEATGALSAAALQGLDRRGELAPLLLCLVPPALGAFRLRTDTASEAVGLPARSQRASAPHPLRI